MGQLTDKKIRELISRARGRLPLGAGGSTLSVLATLEKALLEANTPSVKVGQVYRSKGPGREVIEVLWVGKELATLRRDPGGKELVVNPALLLSAGVWELLDEHDDIEEID
jgi:hypothetical protein